MESREKATLPGGLLSAVQLHTLSVDLANSLTHALSQPSPPSWHSVTFPTYAAVRRTLTDTPRQPPPPPQSTSTSTPPLPPPFSPSSSPSSSMPPSADPRTRPRRNTAPRARSAVDHPCSNPHQWIANANANNHASSPRPYRVNVTSPPSPPSSSSSSSSSSAGSNNDYSPFNMARRSDANRLRRTRTRTPSNRPRTRHHRSPARHSERAAAAAPPLSRGRPPVSAPAGDFGSSRPPPSDWPRPSEFLRTPASANNLQRPTPLCADLHQKHTQHRHPITSPTIHPQAKQQQKHKHQQPTSRTYDSDRYNRRNDRKNNTYSQQPHSVHAFQQTYHHNSSQQQPHSYHHHHHHKQNQTFSSSSPSNRRQRPSSNSVQPSPPPSPDKRRINHHQHHHHQHQDGHHHHHQHQQRHATTIMASSSSGGSRGSSRLSTIPPRGNESLAGPLFKRCARSRRMVRRHFVLCDGVLSNFRAERDIKPTWSESLVGARITADLRANRVVVGWRCRRLVLAADTIDDARFWAQALSAAADSASKAARRAACSAPRMPPPYAAGTRTVGDLAPPPPPPAT